MTSSQISPKRPFGAALNALSTLTGQPDRFFLGSPADSSHARSAGLEFVSMLLLDLEDQDALTARLRAARGRPAPPRALIAVVDELEQADEFAGPELADDEFTRGWAA
ncbi:hypothetical protein [Streptomyces goshikiensis]|uniref:hypothetical protein n=1 Tax=Streptomyces goshikiensis TaxID=1942 RepID=UPI0037A857C3